MSRSEAHALLEMYHENNSLSRFSPAYIEAFVRTFDWLDWVVTLGALFIAGHFCYSFWM